MGGDDAGEEERERKGALWRMLEALRKAVAARAFAAFRIDFEAGKPARMETVGFVDLAKSTPCPPALLGGADRLLRNVTEPEPMI